MDSFKCQADQPDPLSLFSDPEGLAVLSNSAEVEPAASAAPAVAEASVSVPCVLGPRANPVRVAVPVSDVQLAQFEGKSYPEGLAIPYSISGGGIRNMSILLTFARCFARLAAHPKVEASARVQGGGGGVPRSRRQRRNCRGTRSLWNTTAEVQATRESPSDPGTSVERTRVPRQGGSSRRDGTS